jgi:Bifunctional DNA primase/polymerase, N-terminal
MSFLQSAALALAQRGLPVFPCAPRDKVPAIRGGFYSATTNPETIKRQWRIPDRNIGIPTGSSSGFWVLDIDGDEGAAGLEDLQRKHGALPPTREAITGGGGRHLLFKYVGPIQSTASRIAPGIDTRGDGGYIVAPPSIHPNGLRYRWAHDCTELAIAPDWLVRLARTKPSTISERALAAVRSSPPNGQPGGAYGNVALEREVAGLAASLPGYRNHFLNRVGFRLFQLVAGGELDQGLVEDRLIEACHANGLIKDDGLRSVLATIASARAGLQHPRSRRGTR